MKPRCTWSGYLKLSLVTVPVRVYNAISTADKISFNQLHKTCHQRIKQKLVCPVHGEITREDLVKGYEYATDQFVILNETDLEAVRLETTSTIELVQFIRPDELNPMFLDAPYYVGPDGPVAEEGFTVFCEALRRAKRIGIGRVVLGGKEKLVALKPSGKGLAFFTLRYATEVRAANPYFEDLRQEPPDAAQVALAQKLIESKSSPLNLASFTDCYQTAVLDLVKAPRTQPGQVISSQCQTPANGILP
jgi:DNA end-binding protein Ku